MKMIQAQLERPNAAPNSVICTITWVPVELKVKQGDIVTDGATRWTVAQVYPLISEEREGGSPWKKAVQ